jgi:hypothetical protein
MKRLLFLLAVTIGACTSTAFAASLSVASWHLWTGSQTLTKGTCTLSGTSSTVDTYVDEQNPTSSFGGSTTLGVSPKSGKRLWTLVRFDLSTCPSPIPATGGADSATLNLHITTAPGSSQTLDVFPVLSTWSGTLTWNAAQSLALGSTDGTIATGTTSNVTKSIGVTADVDALIKSSSANYGWLISEASSASNVTTLFGSAENATAANRPQLVINYEK